MLQVRATGNTETFLHLHILNKSALSLIPWLSTCTARICCWTQCWSAIAVECRHPPQSIDIPSLHCAQQQACGMPVYRRDRQTERRTLDHFIDPAPHTRQAVSTTKILLLCYQSNFNHLWKEMCQISIALFYSMTVALVIFINDVLLLKLFYYCFSFSICKTTGVIQVQAFSVKNRCRWQALPLLLSISGFYF